MDLSVDDTAGLLSDPLGRHDDAVRLGVVWTGSVSRNYLDL